MKKILLLLCLGFTISVSGQKFLGSYVSTDSLKAKKLYASIFLRALEIYVDNTITADSIKVGSIWVSLYKFSQYKLKNDSIALTGFTTVNRFKDTVSDLRTSINGKQTTISNLADTSKYMEYPDTACTPTKIASGQDLRDTARVLRTAINGKQASGNYATLTDSSFLKYTANGIKPRSTQAAGAIDNSSTDPTHTNRLNYDGLFYSTGYRSYSGSGIDVSRASGFTVQGSNTGGYGGYFTATSGTGALIESNSGRSLYVQQSASSLATLGNLIYLLRNPTMNNNISITNAVIDILDNPTVSGSGTANYKFLNLTQGTRNTIILGNRANTGTINLFDSYRHITGVNKVFEVRDSGEIKVNIGHDSINVKNASLYVFNNISSTKKIAATDSLCLGAFRFIIKYDTLCSVKGTDTLRIHPKRP